MRRTILAALVALCVPLSAQADDVAYILTPSICDNQADSMDYVRLAKLNAGQNTMRMYYYNPTNGSFTAVGHNVPFDSLTTVVISAHGAPGEISSVSSDTFANEFKAAHPSTPELVDFFVCNAAQDEDIVFGGVITGRTPSVLGALAAQYPRNGHIGTAITQVRGGIGATAMQNKNIADPAHDIGSDKIEYYQFVNTSDAGSLIVADLIDKWKQSAKYKATQDTFKKTCKNIIANSLASLPEFIQEVNVTFGATYLQLIAENSNGIPFYACGTNTLNPICR